MPLYNRIVICVDKNTYDERIKDALNCVISEIGEKFKDRIKVKEYSMFTNEFEYIKNTSRILEDYLNKYTDKIQCVLIDMTDTELYNTPSLKLLFEIIDMVEDIPGVVLKYIGVYGNDIYDGESYLGSHIFSDLDAEINIITPLD